MVGKTSAAPAQRLLHTRDAEHPEGRDEDGRERAVTVVEGKTVPDPARRREPIRQLADTYVPDESVLDDRAWDLLDYIDDLLDGDGELGRIVAEALERE